MSVYTLAIIIFILVLSLVAGFIIPSGINPIIPLAFIVVMALAGSVLIALAYILEGYLHEFLIRVFRRAGFTMKPAYSRFLTLAFIVSIMLAFSLLALLFILIYTGASIVTARVLLVLSLITLITGLSVVAIVALFSPKLLPYLRTSGSLVELPFLPATFRVFSKTHLTLYDIFKLIESSSTLKWWASEIKSREVLASERGVSLLTAMGMMAEDHPSLEVRDFIRRISTAGLYAGSPAGVVERVSQQYFERLRSRLEKLTGYMYIALGFLIMSLFLIPILAITLGPVLGIKPSHISIASIATAALIFLVVYIVVQAMYPTGFMYNPSSTLKIFYGASILIVIGAILLMLYAQLKALPFNLLIPYSIVIAVLVPAAALTSAYMARVSAYEKLIRLISDATELASVTGENLLSLTKRMGGNDRRVSELLKEIESSVVNDSVRVKLVSEAPNILYASMIENLIYALRIGAPLTVFAEIASVYEHLNETMKRHQGAMRGVELTLAIIVLAISLFTAVMVKILSGIAASVKTPGGAMIPPLLQKFAITEDPTLLYATITSMIIAAIVAGTLVEKAKTGTLITSARTTLTYIILSLAGISILIVTQALQLL